MIDSTEDTNRFKKGRQCQLQIRVFLVQIIRLHRSVRSLTIQVAQIAFACTYVDGHGAFLTRKNGDSLFVETTDFIDIRADKATKHLGKDLHGKCHFRIIRPIQLNVDFHRPSC